MWFNWVHQVFFITVPTFYLTLTIREHHPWATKRTPTTSDQFRFWTFPELQNQGRRRRDLEPETGIQNGLDYKDAVLATHSLFRSFSNALAAKEIENAQVGLENLTNDKQSQGQGLQELIRPEPVLLSGIKVRLSLAICSLISGNCTSHY